MELLFWLLVSLVFYTYLGYALILGIVAKLKALLPGKPISYGTYEPYVTLVIPAYNEAEIIAEKARNSLMLDYPKRKLRILFMTDGSTDETAEILQDFDGVEVSHTPHRAGKSAAENRAMTLVASPIVIFSDANTFLNSRSIRLLVRHYRDASVGAVSGEKRVISQRAEAASAAGEGLYWRYESTIKRWESRFHTLVGAAGELISFRTELVQDLDEDTILDDFIQSVWICLQGYRVLYEPEAYAVESASDNVGEELKRKIRISAGGWQAMSRLPALLRFWEHPQLTWQYVSHRVMRWSISTLALPLILLVNLYLAFDSTFYAAVLMAQLMFYGMALVGWGLENRRIRFKVLFVPYYFAMMNYAVMAGFLRWRKGSQEAAWDRAKRAKV
ncbi:MAG: glycosyltransferase family 2 protein [Schleiferiaceae bacterium]|nr:glycosyltransferase family 2 protein [Schleiferiaceae bacterium]MDR9441346.1 glycosyltransferase family 2 protein [Schleiferiaceae bacterium]